MPSDPRLRVHVERHPGAFVIAAGGEIDLSNAEAIPDAARRIDGAAPGSPVLIDLSAVDFIDSSGLRAVLEARRSIDAAGHPFALLRPSESVERLLELVDLTGHLPVVRSMDSEALAELS